MNTHKCISAATTTTTTIIITFTLERRTPKAYSSTFHTPTPHTSQEKTVEMVSTLQGISKEPLFPGKMLGHFIGCFFNILERAIVETLVLEPTTPESRSFQSLNTNLMVEYALPVQNAAVLAFTFDLCFLVIQLPLPNFTCYLF